MPLDDNPLQNPIWEHVSKVSRKLRKLIYSPLYHSWTNKQKQFKRKYTDIYMDLNGFSQQKFHIHHAEDFIGKK